MIPLQILDISLMIINIPSRISVTRLYTGITKLGVVREHINVEIPSTANRVSRKKVPFFYENNIIFFQHQQHCFNIFIRFFFVWDTLYLSNWLKYSIITPKIYLLKQAVSRVQTTQTYTLLQTFLILKCLLSKLEEGVVNPPPSPPKKKFK